MCVFMVGRYFKISLQSLVESLISQGTVDKLFAIALVEANGEAATCSQCVCLIPRPAAV